jgi:hypothetical protein
MSQRWEKGEGFWENGKHPTHRDHGDGNGSSIYLQNSNQGAECWASTFYDWTDRSLWTDFGGFAAVCEARVINDNGTPYYGNDVVYCAQLGFDPWNSGKGDSWSATPGSGNYWDMKDAEGRPKNQMDGGNSRWRPIRGGDWQQVGLITMVSYQKRGNMFKGYTLPWPFDVPPHGLTEQQVRDSHPDWVIDGAVTPDPVAVDPTKRRNYALYSEDLTNAYWGKGGVSVTAKANPPAPLLAWQTIATTAAGSGIGVARHFAGLPAGLTTFSFIADNEVSDWIAVRVVNPEWNKGVWLFFDVDNGVIGAAPFYQGGFANAVPRLTLNAGGGYKIEVTCTTDSEGWGMEVYPAGADGEYTRVIGRSVNVGGFQAESFARRTTYKRTTNAIVERTLTTVNDTLAPTTIATNGTAVFTILLFDNIGDPWDQFDAIALTSSNSNVATVSAIAGPTNASGITTAAVTAKLALGTAILKATAGGITSAGETVTVQSSAIVLDPPAAPVVTLGDAQGLKKCDTMTIAVPNIDSDATDVVIEFKPSTGSTWGIAGTIAKTALPHVFTNFAVGEQYDIRARVVLNAQTSTSGPMTTVTMHRLLAYGHFDPDAAGVRNVSVSVGRGADPQLGVIFPTQLLRGLTGQNFDDALVTYAGKTYARMVVNLASQPTSGPKVYAGTMLDMVVSGMVNGKEHQSKILHGITPTGAIVVEVP